MVNWNIHVERFQVAAGWGWDSREILRRSVESIEFIKVRSATDKETETTFMAGF